MSTPLHVVVRPRSGALSLAPFVVSDVVEYIGHVEKSIAARQRGDLNAERSAVIEAERVWRGAPTPPQYVLTGSALLADLVGELILMRERQIQMVTPAGLAGNGRPRLSRFPEAFASGDPRFLHALRVSAVLCAIADQPSDNESLPVVDAEVVRDVLKLDPRVWERSLDHWVAQQILETPESGRVVFRSVETPSEIVETPESGRVVFRSVETPSEIVETLDVHEFRSICGRLCDCLLSRAEHEMSASLGRRLVRLARSSDRRVVHQAATVQALVRHAEQEFRRSNFDESIAGLTTALGFAEESLSIEIRLRRAEAFRLAARWDEAEEDLTRAQAIAQVMKDDRSEALAILAMAHVTWDPQRFGDLEARLRSLLDVLEAESDRLLRIRVQACLAGGTYQDGTSGAGFDGVELARIALGAIDEFSDPWTRAELAIWCRKGLLDVASTDESLSLAQRIEDEASGSDSHLANGILAQIVDHLRRGALVESLHQTNRYHQLAERTGSPLHRFIALTNEAMWKIARGEFTTAEALIDEAAPIGAQFGGITAKQISGAQRIWVWRMTGAISRDAELSKVVRQALPPDGRLPIWRVTKALILADGHDYAAAADALRVALPDAEQSINDLKRGPLRIAVLALAAEVLYAVRSLPPEPWRDRMAAALQQALERHGDNGVLVGWPTLYLGPTTRYIALAAAAQGRTEEALRLLARARSHAADLSSIQGLIDGDLHSLQRSKRATT